MTTKKNTELAVIPSKEQLQKNLAQAIKAIDTKLKTLGVDTSYIYKAPSAFKMNELDGNVVNIQTCVVLNYLVMALGKMRRLKREAEEVYESLGVKEYSVTLWLGAPVDTWISDLTHRVKLVNNQVLISKLTQHRQELVTHQSAEQRLFNALNNTVELLK